MGADSKDDSEATNSDDDVLNSSFTRRPQTQSNTKQNRRRVFPDKDPFDTDEGSDIDINYDGAEAVHDVQPTSINGGKSEYDDMVYNMAHSATTSRSTQSQKASGSGNTVIGNQKSVQSVKSNRSKGSKASNLSKRSNVTMNHR